MNRRDALLTTGSMVISASLGALACGGSNAVAQNNPKAPPTPPAGSAGGGGHGAGGPIPANAALHEAAHHCLTKGDACIAHCIASLATGDTMMANCMKTVRDMHAVMQGLAAAAASGNKHLPALAKAAMEFCKDCEAECRKHEAHHVVCKECADACAKTVAACQKIAA